MSVVKDVNVNGRSAADTKLLIDYLIDGLKTGGGKYIAGLGFVTDNYLDEFQAVKRAHQKTGGRQFRQITIAPSPAENSCTDGDYVVIGRRIAEYYYERGFQTLVTVHLDSDTRHIHIMLNSVDFKTGRMFSQSRSELNRFKLHCNHVFAEYGLDQIRKPAETLTDTTVHELCDGFDCLELFDEIMADKASALADLFEEPAGRPRSYESQGSACCFSSDTWPDLPFMHCLDTTFSGQAEYLTPPHNYPIKEETIMENKLKNQELPVVTTDQFPAELGSSTPGLTLNFSKNLNIAVPEGADSNDIADLVNSVEPLPETERVFNTHLGVSAIAELQNHGFDIPVTVNSSTNINVMFEDIMKSCIIDVPGDDED